MWLEQETATGDSILNSRDKAHQKLFTQFFLTITPAMWEKLRETSWSCKSQLICYIPALLTASQGEDNADKALSLHHPCKKHREGAGGSYEAH